MCNLTVFSAAGSALLPYNIKVQGNGDIDKMKLILGFRLPTDATSRCQDTPSTRSIHHERPEYKEDKSY